MRGGGGGLLDGVVMGLRFFLGVCGMERFGGAEFRRGVRCGGLLDVCILHLHLEKTKCTG